MQRALQKRHSLDSGQVSRTAGRAAVAPITNDFFHSARVLAETLRMCRLDNNKNNNNENRKLASSSKRLAKRVSIRPVLYDDGQHNSVSLSRSTALFVSLQCSSATSSFVVSARAAAACSHQATPRNLQTRRRRNNLYYLTSSREACCLLCSTSW